MLFVSFLQVPVDRLVRLLQVLDNHVLDGAQLLLHLPPVGLKSVSLNRLAKKFDWLYNVFVPDFG